VSIDLTVVKRVIDSVGKVAEELTQVDYSAGHKPEGRNDSGNTRNDDDGDIEVGYVINSKYKNNGYCSEALKGLISYLFSKEVKAVTSGAFEGNNASFKVMEKAGMSKIDKVDRIFKFVQEYITDNGYQYQFFKIVKKFTILK
jgi:RimJ/RimL family protein N-acetyltransferase